MNLASILVSLLLLVPQAATEKTSKGDLKITPITHGTLMFEYGGKVIHVDPAQTDLTKYPKASGRSRRVRQTLQAESAIPVSLRRFERFGRAGACRQRYRGARHADEVTTKF